jgi:type I restriction enzyme S subunit
MTRRLRGIGGTDQGQVRTPRINFSELGSIEVPVPPLEHQEGFVQTVSAEESWSARTRDLLETQVSVIEERLVSSITATVTGEMEVAA